MYFVDCLYACIWLYLLDALLTHVVALSPSPASISSWLDCLVGSWIWCTPCLVLNHWWILLPAPGFAHHVQTLWDCVPWVRALPGLGSPSSPGLSPPWGAAISHCSVMLAVQKSLLSRSLTHQPTVLLPLPKSCPSQRWVMPPEGLLP